MKICFLTPPALDGKAPAERIFGCNYGIYTQPNIFMLYPATILHRAGHEVRFLDFPARGKGRRDFEARPASPKTRVRREGHITLYLFVR